MKPKILGLIGENYVGECLVKNGFAVIKRRFTGRTFEIDVIAQKARVIYFIEVKTRETFDYYENYKSINNFKLLKIKRGISAFLNKNPRYLVFQKKIIAAFVSVNPYTNKMKVEFCDCLS